MKSLIKSFDSLPWIVKLILALPALDIVWNIYRLIRSLVKENLLGIIIAIILIIPGAAFMWVVDLISIALFKRVLWIN